VLIVPNDPHPFSEGTPVVIWPGFDLGFHHSTFHCYPLITASAVPFGQFDCSNLRIMRTATMVVKDRANPCWRSDPCAHAFAPHIFRLDSIC